MEDNTKKKISRRDAMKLLAAAVGAATVANLPSEWNQPVLAASQLPEHARQSVNRTVSAGLDTYLGCNSGDPFTSTAQITPPDSGIDLRYEIVVNTAPATILTPTPGTLTTVNGAVSLDVDAYSPSGGIVEVIWSFVNPSDGSGSSSQLAINNGC